MDEREGWMRGRGGGRRERWRERWMRGRGGCEGEVE